MFESHVGVLDFTSRLLLKTRSVYRLSLEVNVKILFRIIQNRLLVFDHDNQVPSLPTLVTESFPILPLYTLPGYDPHLRNIDSVPRPLLLSILLFPPLLTFQGQLNLKETSFTLSRWKGHGDTSYKRHILRKDNTFRVWNPTVSNYPLVKSPNTDRSYCKFLFKNFCLILCLLVTPGARHSYSKQTILKST